jgi:type IV secretory pathway VirJ component
MRLRHLSVQLVVLIVSLFALFYILNCKDCRFNPPKEDSITIENLRFGPIKVYGSKNTDGKLILYLRNSVSEKKSEFIDTILKNGTVVAEVNFKTYSELAKNEGLQINNNCYECAGELTRLSQVIQNRLKMTKLDKALIVSEGDEITNFLTSINQYLGADFKICRDLTCDILDSFSNKELTQEHSLPIIENIPEKINTDYFVIFLSGDGGWATIDKDITEYLVKDGVPVIGLDSLRYFWSKKDPEQLSADISLLLNKYKNELKLKKVVLLGFSLGANMLPFVLTRISEPDLTLIRLTALLSPTKHTDFEVNFTDWLPINSEEAGLSVSEEINKISNHKIICIAGDEDTDSACKNPAPKDITTFQVPGTHHFGGDYEGVSYILKNEFKKHLQQ